VQTIVYTLRGVCLTKHHFFSGRRGKKRNVEKDGDELRVTVTKETVSKAMLFHLSGFQEKRKKRSN
jgi:hypothetical protein